MEAIRPKNLSFEEQFQSAKYLEFKKGGITVVDITPEVLKDEVPVLMVPGWTENYKTYSKCLRMLHDSGRRAISFGFSRRGGRVPKNDEYPQSELRKALQMHDVLREKHIFQTDVIAHSEGAMNILIAADLKPSAFRNIVLDRPMGMVGPEGKLDLFGRWLKNRIAEAKLRPDDPSDPVSGREVFERTMKYFFANPVRAVGEGLRMTRFDLAPLISEVVAQGVKISIIGGVDDLMSPADRQIEHARGEGALPVEGYYSVTGTHNMISIQPEKYMAFAINALESLQKRGDVLDLEPR